MFGMSIKVVCFSLDRASQLQFLIQSIKQNLNLNTEWTILYSGSNQQFKDGYTKLKDEKLIEANWVEESCFATDLSEILKQNKNELIMLLTDDSVIFERFDPPEPIE
jgi:hypothetical protein